MHFIIERTVCCRRFWWKYVPVLRSSLFLLPVFLHWSLEEYILVFWFLFSFLCSLFLSFFRHFMFVLRFDHFRVTDGFVCLYFLPVVSCAFAVSRFLWIHMSRLQHPLRLHKNPGYSVMLKWRPRHLWIHVPPSHDYPQLCPARPPIPSFAFAGC